jgi:hypothetical protein
MARDMGSGLRAYKMTLGQPASRQDLVDIFATGPDVVPATIVEQEAFRDQWWCGAKRPSLSLEPAIPFVAELQTGRFQSATFAGD